MNINIFQITNNKTDNVTLEFAPGETEENIRVEILGDTQIEEDETFDLSLSNPNDNLVFANYDGIATIEDNDDISRTIDISDLLNGKNGFVLNGIDGELIGGFTRTRLVISSISDNSGTSVSTAGDINGDGFNDVIIGAPGADPNSGQNGESYIVFGSFDIGNSGSIELSSLNGENGFVINGTGNDSSSFFGNQSGSFVSNIGDINGDGFDDIIIDSSGESKSYIIFGGSDIGNSGVIEISSLNGENGFVIDSTNIGSAGDINGDGFDDFIIGDNNSKLIYLVPGSSEIGNSGAIELSSLNNENSLVINGIDFEFFNLSVGSVGDVNGDGFEDIIIGAPDSRENAGESYVLFGSDIGNSGTIELSSLNGSNGFAIKGIDLNDNSGFSVSSAGDINGDGFEDIIIGAPDADPDGKSGAGESYIIFGGIGIGNSGTVELSSLNGQNGFVIKGIDGVGSDEFGTRDDRSGFSVSSAGDVNGDGFDDIIIGAPYADPNGKNEAGETYLIFGKSEIGNSGTIELSSLDGETGVILNGIDGGGIDILARAGADRFGYSVSSAGDIDGDNLDDIIIGAPYADPNDKDEAGESYVLFGSTFTDNDNPRTIELFRFRNTTFETGTYNFVGAAEKDAILASEDFSRTFELEGRQDDGSVNPAFIASLDPGDDLIPFYRLRNLQIPGTYLFVSTEEYGAIFAPDSDQKENWVKEGLDERGNDIAEFYLYDREDNLGTEFNRFQNTQNNTFLYAGTEETAAIESNPNLSNLFLNQGGAFESFI